MLLVDVPHLASVAERTGATECITDDRLQPVVRAVIDGAKEGRDPDLQDLLTEVDPSAHRLIYDSVFAGEYRGLSDQGADPQVVLASLVRACRSETLERRIIDIKNQMRDAQAGGFPDRARELAQVWMELRREQERLLKASGPLAERSPSDSRPQEAAAPVPDPGPGANGADEAPGGLPN
jgi:hypothetical protein